MWRRDIFSIRSSVTRPHQLQLKRDPELVQGRERAVALCTELNSTPASDTSKREQITRTLLGRVGDDPFITSPFFADYGTNIYAGHKFYANAGCVVLDCGDVTIGDNVLLGPNVQIYAATHPTDPTLRLEGKENSKPINIGSNVWIGGGAIVCPGVSIGDHTTIGAGSVVTKDIPSCCVAAGNPARIIKHVPPPPVK